LLAQLSGASPGRSNITISGCASFCPGTSGARASAAARCPSESAARPSTCSSGGWTRAGRCRRAPAGRRWCSSRSGAGVAPGGRRLHQGRPAPGQRERDIRARAAQLGHGGRRSGAEQNALGRNKTPVEFVSNGTLYDHLHVKEPRSLPWSHRLRIATETAKAMAYLPLGCVSPHNPQRHQVHQQTR
jgi:hypothetical protein